jgi:hypothetical protein
LAEGRGFSEHFERPFRYSFEPKLPISKTTTLPRSGPTFEWRKKGEQLRPKFAVPCRANSLAGFMFKSLL